MDLNQSKLNPRSVKTALLCYFGHNGYKLLDKSTSAVFKSRDVIFKERITHLVKQLTPTMLSNDNNPFTNRFQQNSNVDIVKNNLKLDLILLLIHGIALRLHRTNNNNIPDTNNSALTTTKNTNNDSDNLSLALKKPREL